MKVYEALAGAFVKEGTLSVFGLMGHANQEWIDAIVKHGVDVYEARHEGSACAMADGWARQRNAPGVCTTTSGPGTSQLTTALIVAKRAGTPLVAFCGDQPLKSSAWERDSGSQSMDQKLFAQAAECGFVQLTSAETAYECVQRAFYLARTESRPILFSAPHDIQNMAFDDEEEYVPSTSLLSVAAIAPNPAVIGDAAKLLANSEKPVIIVGRGAMVSDARDAILSLGRRVGALIATSLVAINWLRNDEQFHAGVSGLYASRVAQELFQEADCVIAIGASLNMYTIEGGYLFPNASFIHVDTQNQVVMGNGKSADCYVHGDARLASEALEQELAKRSIQKQGYRSEKIAEVLETAHFDSKVYDIEKGFVDPREACNLLDECLPGEISLILGAGHQSNIAGMAFRRERSYIAINKSFGAIGHGLTTAIGAVVATGKKPAVLTEGDAGAMMCIGEFETAVRYELPLLVAVFNNQCLASEVQKAMLKGMDPDLARISTPDLGAVGKAFGGRGYLVNNLENLRVAAKEFADDPAPTLLDIRIDPNVLAIQYRRKFLGDDSN